MIDDITVFLSKTARNLKRSEIRELLHVTRRPDVISFGGGLPDPTTFPIKDLEDILVGLLQEKGALALQYGLTEGETTLREEIVKWLNRENGSIQPDNVLITTGSQQGLDLLAKVFLDPNDIVVMELPSYIGGLQAFSAYRAHMIGVPQDAKGMRMDLLEKLLIKLENEKKRPKFLYVVPDFQNPSGITMSLERRKSLLEFAYTYQLPIIEDSPYRDLRFTGAPLPSIFNLDTQSHVIALRTFSKLLCPGLRVAWIMAPNQWMDRLVIAKQSMDLCSPSLTQFIVAEYLRRGLLPKQIEKIRKVYGRKLNVMLDALRTYMPPGVEWSKPEGGLFLWITLPPKVNANRLFEKAIAQKVAYVVGSAFHCNGKGQNSIRINFSYPSEAQITEGIKRLARMFNENM